MPSVYLYYLQYVIQKHQLILKVVTVKAGRSHQIQGYLEDAIDRNWDGAGWEVERKASIGKDVKEKAGGRGSSGTTYVRMPAYFSGPNPPPPTRLKMYKIQRNSLGLALQYGKEFRDYKTQF